ncbi:Crp/Fnr family transcriptional regulator [Ensifer sp. ENS11]|nr:Crp/Fnr family transcriptional regulator [Ensifer sp. ENS11]NOV20394.1 Crp/Fnr family transcriptional regulator [Ensifer canadensis]PSS62767.1 Crp/Fnr family transcriptional regulator [Ensifer sp. NM-2]
MVGQLGAFIGSSRFRELSSFDTDQQRSELSVARKRVFPAGSILFEPEGRSCVLFFISGWCVSRKILANGTRIVIDFMLRGDMLWTLSSEMTQETIQALSDVAVYEFAVPPGTGGPNLSQRIQQNFVHEMLKRQVRMTERLANIARRDALERTGHLLLELAVRAGRPDRLGFDGFDCPLTQSDIGDAVGLSTVHINRVLKEMRLKGLLSFRNGIVEFLDRRRLAELVDFDPGYLSTNSG